MQRRRSVFHEDGEVMGAGGPRACGVALVVLLLGACRPGPRNEQPSSNGIGVEGEEGARITSPRQPPDASTPRTHARTHVLLGIDFSRPLHLPECARFYDSFDRPDRTCVYRRSADHKPFKIEFSNGAVPGFLKWNNALVATDSRGRPNMLRFDVADARALQGAAVDAMLATFGPPTRVENALGHAKVGTWEHDDYLIRYFFDPTGGGIVQMETRKFHAAAVLQEAATEARNAKE